MRVQPNALNTEKSLQLKFQISFLLERYGKPFRMSVVGLSWPVDKGEYLPLSEKRTLDQAHYEMVVGYKGGYNGK
jgi:hypothetical protein